MTASIPTATLVIELGTEEMPPLKLNAFSETWLTSFEDQLKAAQFSFQQCRVFITPRRLGLFVEGITRCQPAQQIEKKGPNPDHPAAVEGFLKSLNIRLVDCERRNTPKGDFLFYTQIQAGKTLTALLPDMLQQALKALPIPKSMRWGAHEFSFTRPVHWLLALLDQEVLPLELFGLQADRLTYGHRFHHPAALSLRQAKDYLSTLEQAYVRPDQTARQAFIQQEIEGLAATLKAAAVLDPGLLEEVTGLTEWPVALLATFEPAFLELPAEVSICAMQTHQRYFPLRDLTSGRLLNQFVVISNTQGRDMTLIRAGHERVVRARLSDALYFYQHDGLTPLSQRIASLTAVVFQNQLGSYADKIKRVTQIAELLAPQLSLLLPAGTLPLACSLIKADLCTQMVSEFPELQGIMGAYYARAEGFPEPLALAIREHYLPRFAGDALPESPLGLLLALADRLDTLFGIFAVGLTPTGSKDPYALRRQAIAVIRLCVEKALPFSWGDLNQALAKAYAAFIASTALSFEKIMSQLQAFFIERFRMWLQEAFGFSLGIIDAALHSHYAYDLFIDGPFLVYQRAQALADFRRDSPDSANQLATAHKRIHNFFKRCTAPQNNGINEALLKTDGKALYEHSKTMDHMKGSPQDSLKKLATLAPYIEAFFDNELILSEDIPFRENQLNLVTRVHGLLCECGDFSYLMGTD